MSEKKEQKPSGRWPSQRRLLEAIEIFMEFRAVCQHFLQTGHWATIDFPSKHHINSILSVQFRSPEDLERDYGKWLAMRAMEVVPHCKSYAKFLRDDWVISGMGSKKQ